MSTPSTQLVTRIRPTRGWTRLGLGEVWEYRELLYFLIWREIRARYRQMALGPLWIVLVPLANMLVFAFFMRVAKIPSDNIPAPLFVLAGLLPWQLFAEATRRSSTSLVTNLPVITKVYFPRLLVPLSAAFVGAVDFCIALLVLLALMLAYGVAPGPMIAVLPLYLVLTLATALAVGLWLAAVAVKFRDVNYGIGYILLLWMFASPVFYPARLVSPPWRHLYELNPMVHVIEGFRWAIFGSGQAPSPMLAVSAGLVLVFLVAGAWVFRRTDRAIVDYV